jgi:putative membrane protein
MNQRNIWGSLLSCILVLGIATAASGLSQNPPNQPGSRPSTAPTTPAPRPAAASASDSFLTQAIESNAAEVQLAQLAATKAQNQRVKDYANMLVKDHSAALEKLQKLQQGGRASQADRVSLNAEHEKLKTRLSGISGAQFDREYIEAMVVAHRKSADLFQKQIGSGAPPADAKSTDSQVTSLAREILPTVKHHLEQAESIQKMLSSPAK